VNSSVTMAHDYLPRIKLHRRRAESRRAFGRHPGTFLGIAAVHAAVVVLTILAPGERARSLETEPLVPILLRPAVLISDDPSVAPVAVRRHARSASAASMGPSPDSDPPVITTIGIGTMAPQLMDGSLDSSPFARAAGLQPGQGATVVLRLEVLTSGELGRVEVEVSGGTPDIDRAAVAYARALVWTGGMIDGRPATIEIRWAARLQA
jgi:TonB family protein